MAARTMKRTQGKAKAARQAKADAIAKAKAIAPSVEVRMGSAPATKYRGNRDIFGRLVEDHDRHRALLAMIDETQGKSADRQALFRDLAREVKSHAAAEEQALWSSVLRNPKTTDFARHAIAEHKELDDMLADLAAHDMASPGWLRRFGETKDECLHHVREEAQEQFVAAEKSLSAADARYLRGVFNRRKKEEKAAATIEKKISLKIEGLFGANGHCLCLSAGHDPAHNFYADPKEEPKDAKAVTRSTSRPRRRLAIIQE